MMSAVSLLEASDFRSLSLAATAPSFLIRNYRFLPSSSYWGRLLDETNV